MSRRRPPAGYIGPIPRRHVAPLMSGLIGLLFLAGVGWLILDRRGGGDDPPPAATTVAAEFQTAPGPTPARSVGAATPRAAASPGGGAVACAEACLFRVPDAAPAQEALAQRGLRAAYAYGGHLWSGGDRAQIAELAAVGQPPTVIAPDLDTLRLYVVRAPSALGDGDAALVEGMGEIVDQVDGQYLIRATRVPMAVSDLTSIGYWVEKFPPVVPAPKATDRAALPPLDNLEALIPEVSVEELETTITALQGSSSTDGTGIGTRYYGSPGNVMAGEYLYRRIAEYGLEVWYEDFVTQDGLLALNVVAEAPGTDPSKMYLVLGHYDSLNEADQTSAPGADDNATGVAGMLEIARILSQRRLQHPVRFFFTNVEERDLQGVKAFAARAIEEETPLVAAFNMDAIGSAQHGAQLVLNGDEGSAWIEDLLIETNDAYGLGQSLLVRNNPIIVADDNFLREVGIPTVLLARELFGWSSIHHTVDDTLATVDLANVRSATQLVLVSVATLAQGATAAGDEAVP